MKSKVEQMITTLLPDAIPGTDFVVAITEDETAQILHWNSGKLGAFPGLEKMREVYLKYAKKRKEKLPSFDDSDPLPYMAEKARRMLNVDQLPKVDVQNVGGMWFVREKK